MHRFVSGLLRLGVAPLILAGLLGVLGLVGTGCTGSPIGDPCVPESIPSGGFDPREVYLETSSVQCRTRVCMVYQVNGDPREIDPVVAEQQVFCSCRCSVPEGGQANTPLCDCGDGFTCIDDVVTTGGTGVVGGYCVPCIKANDDRGLNPMVYDECPTDG
ncbi:MAG TPA: hypothetical protein RMH99_26240 [Sandaracinaceae bacterium LLY-WYZ-13_1]|nr:hypothetical protein [Sandaracinaceae bacterium LLY-WYZ-13_1]